MGGFKALQPKFLLKESLSLLELYVDTIIDMMWPFDWIDILIFQERMG